MTRKFARNSLEELFRGIENAFLRVDQITSNQEKTLPFRERTNLPPGVEGQIVIAEYVPPAPAGLNDIILLGYRTSSDYQSVFRINQATGTETEIFAGDVGSSSDPYPDWLHAKWSRDGTKIYASNLNQSGGGTHWPYEIWEVSATGGSPTMLWASPTITVSTRQQLAFKELATGGIKFLYSATAGGPITKYDVPGTSSTTIFNTSSLSSPYTNQRAFAIQFNEDGSKFSFWVPPSTGFVIRMYTINIDGTGLQGPVLTSSSSGGSPDTGTDGCWWQPGSNRFAYLNIGGGISTRNYDGTGDATLTSSNAGQTISWNANGTKIAFVNSSDNLVKIMNADGSGLVSVPSSTMSGSTQFAGICWSQDGSKIARISNASSGTVTVKMIDVASLTVSTTYTYSLMYFASFMHWFLNEDYGDF